MKIYVFYEQVQLVFDSLFFVSLLCSIFTVIRFKNLPLCIMLIDFCQYIYIHKYKLDDNMHHKEKKIERVGWLVDENIKKLNWNKNS